MIKKKFITILVILSGVAFGVFVFNSGKTTLYIKNNAPRLSTINIGQKIYQAEDRIGDLSNTIIPEITIPENLTENFTGFLAKEIISKNNQPKDSNASEEQKLAVPDPSKIAEEFIKNGLVKANENILNIKPPELKTLYDNSKETTELYLAEAQKILSNNLTGEPLLSILEEINKNNGGKLEKLFPVISAHETAANQIEEKPVPDSIKDLMIEEVRLLRITANVLRALTNIENDPLGALAATKQFEAVVRSWLELQIKFNIFVEKINKN